MEILDKINLGYLTDTYVFANTPMYLYHHYRNNQLIQKLANITNVNVLTDLFNKISKEEQYTLKDIVTLYSILIALTFLPYRDSIIQLDKLNISKLEWGNDIKAIFQANNKPWDIVRLHSIEKIQEKRIESSSSNSVFNKKF